MGYTCCFVNSAGPAICTTGPGVLVAVIVGSNGGTGGGALTVWDSAGGGATPACSTIAVISTNCARDFAFNVDLKRGLTVSQTTAANLSLIVE